MPNVIDAINIHVLQVPNSQNGNTAIVSASIILPDGRVITDASSCTPRGPFNDEDTLGTAKTEVIQKIKQKLHMSEERVQEAPRHQETDKNKMNGGGNKPASPNQIGLICRLAQQENVEELVRSRFGKALQDLRGCEADSLIKELKS